MSTDTIRAVFFLNDDPTLEIINELDAHENRIDELIETIKDLVAAAAAWSTRVEKLEVKVGELHRYAKGIDIRTGAVEEKWKDTAAEGLRLALLESSVSQLIDELIKTNEDLKALIPGDSHEK